MGYSYTITWALFLMAPLIRITCSHVDLLKFNPPLWVRRMLFVVNVYENNIALAAIILQAVTNFCIILFVLSLLGFCPIYHIAGFDISTTVLVSAIWFPMVILRTIYFCVCDAIIRKRADDEWLRRNRK